MSDSTPAARPGSSAWQRRRSPSSEPRRRLVPVRYNETEYAAMLANAAAVRMAPSAYIASTSLSPRLPGAGSPGDAYRADLLLNLLGLHRQMRGACTNLNQAVVRLHALGKPVDELPAIATYVGRVTAAVDDLVAEMTGGRPRRTS